jgi:hypothetical protein
MRCFLLFEFDFGGRAHADDGYAAGQLGETFLELFFVEVGGRFFDLGFDLGDAGLDGISGAGAVDDSGLFLGDADLTGTAEVANLDAVEFAAEFFGDDGAAGEGGDVFEHGFAAVAEAGGFDSDGPEGAAEFVDNKGGKGFAFNIFGDDQQFLALLDDFFENGQQVGDGADFGGR